MTSYLKSTRNVGGSCFEGAGRALGRAIVVVAVLFAFTFSAIAQTIYEAENATLSGPVVATQYGGYSGTGYADYNNASSDYVEFFLVAGSAGNYPITFRYANGGTGDRPLQLNVNGVTVISSLSFPVTGGWANWAYTATNNVSLATGLNAIRITSIGFNGANVDNLTVTSNGTQPVASNAANAPLRRPISPSQPMLLVHIDTWNYPDPQKIINLIPQDIRPYVVMNISLSISHDTNNVFNIVQYGYETAKSWVRTCAENNMWCMIQPASGGYRQLSDVDMSVYEEFFRDYPNFIGFNYAEQFWGFDNNALSPTWTQRIAHFVDLMKLNQKYGGYLVVSWCGTQYSPSINPIAMMKLNPTFAAICQQSPKNFILCEKYTTSAYKSDIESLCLGTYLSGYSGQYGMRYDNSGWSDATGTNQNFTLATAGAPMLEHMMLTGETVIDGPEIIWSQDIQGLGNGTTSDGYTTRQWGLYSQYSNVILDIFRKVLDGTVRIPTRQEVINRTKVAIIQNVSSGGNDNIYSSPQTLFEGLYRMDVDGDYQNNLYFTKKTGRYPTIPTVYQLADTNAQSFQLQVSNSLYSTRWPTLTAKTNELNPLFPQEYTGDIYAGRNENAWVIYNPYKTDVSKTNQIASGSIPFKYNTCDHVDLTLSRYTAGVMKEYSNSVTFYLGNYDSQINLGSRTDTFAIYGGSSQPTYSWADRASHSASTVTNGWTNGVWTLTVLHNGALDITVNCAGSATGRLTNYTTATVAPPASPPTYTGARQYEAECFDYKSITGYTQNGYSSGISNYTGQGFLNFATSSSADVRDYVTVLKSGTYRLDTKYSVTGNNISTIDLYVNGAKVTTPTFTQTTALSNWATNRQYITLNAGANSIEFKANGAGASSVYFDNMIVAPTSITSGVVIQENKTGFTSVDGTVDTNYSGYTGDGYANTSDSTGAGINWNLNFDASLEKAFTFSYASTNDGTADLLIGGVNVAANIQFPSTGAWTNWDYVTLYAYTPAGTSALRLQSSSANGLPNIDYLEVTGGWAGTPPTPGLTALAVAKNQINLSWMTSSNATSYNVKRSLTSGGSYSLVASGVTATNFNDNGLATGTTYYYVVSAVSGLGEGSDSVEASATTYSGVVNVVGSTSGLYTVTSGSGITAGTFDLDDSADVLVVGVYIDANSISCLTNVTTFGGVPPSGFIQTSGAGNRQFALYWLNPNTSVGQNLVIGANASANIGAGYFALQLSGVDTNAAVVKTGATTTDAGNVNITTAVANSLIVSFYSANDSGLTLTPTAPLTQVGSALTTINGAGGGGSLATATNNLATAGTQNLAWSSSGTTANQGVNGFAFAPFAITLPAAPTGLSAVGNYGVVNLNWLQSTNANITTNRVYRSATGANCSYSLLASLPANTNYADSVVVNGMPYYYSVTAVNANGESGLSVSATATLKTNTPPRLAAITNRTIGAGVKLSVTNSAADPDVPPQTLTFSLLTAPTNAVLNTNSGVLIWRPLVTQADTSNPFSVKVADNGSPSMSATQSFVVTVTSLAKPAISSPLFAASQLVLQVNGASGPDYQVQASTNLVNWTGVFITNSPAMPFFWTNGTAGTPMKFFRILAGPPFQ